MHEMSSRKAVSALPSTRCPIINWSYSIPFPSSFLDWLKRGLRVETENTFIAAPATIESSNRLPLPTTKPTGGEGRKDGSVSGAVAFRPYAVTIHNLTDSRGPGRHRHHY
jgi:hypothetical protein